MIAHDGRFWSYDVNWIHNDGDSIGNPPMNLSDPSNIGCELGIVILYGNRIADASIQEDIEGVM